MMLVKVVGVLEFTFGSLLVSCVTDHVSWKIVVSSCALLDIPLSGSDLMINLTMPFSSSF